MPYETVILEKRDKIGILTLNRPEARNALNPALRRDIAAALDEVEQDMEIEVLILTGAGKAFCAGVDLKYLGKQSIEAGKDQVPLADQTNRSASSLARLDTFRCPSIGAINGPAITGGFELALSCDILIAAENAFFGDTHARVGIIPGAGLSQKLSRIVGIKRALEISLGCDFISANEAAQMGFVNHVVPADKLMETALAMANKIIGNHKETMLKYRELIKEGHGLDYRDGIRLERLESALWVTRVKSTDVEARRLGILEKGRKQASDAQER